MKKWLFLLFFAFDVYAKVTVIDGDSLRIDGKDIRLIGIDAPEYDQICFDKQGSEYNCGQEAYLFLKILIETGLNKQQNIRCKKIGVDKYKRDLNECYIGNKNINKTIIKAGYATTYRHDIYKQEENEAKTNKNGIWQGKFMRPELYRILQKQKNNQKNFKNRTDSC